MLIYSFHVYGVILLQSGWLTCNTHVIPNSPRFYPIPALSIFFFFFFFADKSFQHNYVQVMVRWCLGQAVEVVTVVVGQRWFDTVASIIVSSNILISIEVSVEVTFLHNLEID